MTDNDGRMEQWADYKCKLIWCDSCDGSKRPDRSGHPTHDIQAPDAHGAAQDYMHTVHLYRHCMLEGDYEFGIDAVIEVDGKPYYVETYWEPTSIVTEPSWIKCAHAASGSVK